MIQLPRLSAVLLGCTLVLLGACGESDRLGPTTEPVTSTTPVPLNPAAAVAPGIMFGSSGLTSAQLTSVHTGLWRPLSPSTMLSELAKIKAKGGRIVVVLVGDRFMRNPDNTFNLAGWKSALDRYRGINFNSYIADGTIVGHRLMDEPHFDGRWGGRTIPHSTIEEAAKYSKQLWPAMPTIAAAPLNWLAATTVTYTHLDAGLSMFRSHTSKNPAQWAAAQAGKAKQKGLGMLAGLNVLDGGNGSSGFRGNLPRKWAMSAAELRSYGSALLGQAHVCGFVMWQYTSEYYGRADIKSAMTDLSSLARKHVQTSCRQ
jgi:hypothetical protein